MTRCGAGIARSLGIELTDFCAESAAESRSASAKVRLSSASALLIASSASLAADVKSRLADASSGRGRCASFGACSGSASAAILFGSNERSSSSSFRPRIRSSISRSTLSCPVPAAGEPSVQVWPRSRNTHPASAAMRLQDPIWVCLAGSVLYFFWRTDADHPRLERFDRGTRCQRMRPLSSGTLLHRLFVFLRFAALHWCVGTNELAYPAQEVSH